MSDENEYTDRYKALGMPYPDPATVCRGPCEGIGCYPVKDDDPDEQERALWLAQHAEAGRHECDGWHFVKCPDCNGTGKK